MSSCLELERKQNMVFVTVSTGVGGGAILNGNIYRGSTANALEIGHTTVMKGGPRCGCVIQVVLNL